MTTVQLFHRMGRMTRSGDFTRLSLTEQTDLMDAANSALQEVYGLLPTVYKELTEGFVLPAPVAITGTINNNTTEFSADIFTPDQFGRSVVLDGDANWNQIIDTNKVLNPYQGQSGTINGTVYGDAVYSRRYPFDRIIGNPRFPNQGSTLMMNPNLRPTSDGAGWWLFQQTIGQPLYWWTQAMGNSQGNEPLLVLRFSPAPSMTYVVDVRISYWPKRLVMADYDEATTIPVPDQMLEKALIPLALQSLSMTPIWNPQYDARRYDEAADRARVFLKMMPGQISSPNNRVFTPLGF